MTALLIALLAAFRSSVRSRLELETENLALRHQLAVLQRPAPRRPRLGDTDRLLWVLLSRLRPNWRLDRPDRYALTLSCAGTGAGSRVLAPSALVV